jgi:hypothetical protein
VAEAVVRARFLKRKGGSVTARELLELLEKVQASPELPAWVAAWNQENAR